MALDGELLAIEGRDAALFVADSAGAGVAYARVVGPEGGLGSIATLPSAHVVAAWADGEATQVVTTVGQRLCLTRWDASGLSAPSCVDKSADALVRFAGKLVLLEAREPPPPEDEDSAAPGAKPVKPKPGKPGATKPKKKPAPKAPPPRRKGKSKAKPPREAEAKKRLMESGREVEVWADPWERPACPSDADPASDPDACGPIATGLRYREAMAGLSLVGAYARTEKIELAFYERAEANDGQPRAKIGLGTLDAELAWIEGSHRAFGESKLEPGFLADHTALRVAPLDGGALLLGLRGPRGKCDVTVFAPFVMQMVPNDDCALDARRFLVAAKAAHAGERVDLGDPPALRAADVQRVPFQPSWDVGHLVFGGAHAFGREGEGLVTFARGGDVARLPAPILAERLRLAWGAIAPDGSAFAATDAGLVRVDADGATLHAESGEARGLAGPDRPELAAIARAQAVKIGATWWQSRRELRPLAPLGATKRALAYDAAVLVGGEASGLLIEARGGSVALTRIAPDGAEAPLGVSRVAVGAGLDASPRKGGGALVAAPDPRDPRRARVIVIDASGRAAEAAALDLGAASRFLRLAPRPGGGAWLWDERRTKVVWLDDDGRALSQAAMPAAPAAVCLDGRPLAATVPGPAPGSWVETHAAGHCIVGEPAFAGGELRWLGSAVAGPHARAELARVPLDLPDAPPTTAGAAPTFGALGAPTPRRCPLEMVLVGESLCVDRWEGTLLDEKTGRLLSPDYPASPNLLKAVLGDWATGHETAGDLFARALPLPALSAWQQKAELAPSVEVRAAVIPSGYVTGLMAREACERAGKRLCKLDEWKRACKGERATLFPYGASWEEGACNVNGTTHPGVLLHDNASVGHLDPRLNRVGAAKSELHASDAAPLLHATGASPRCASRWGEDAIWDMVGNVDEWVDEGKGAFAGGFYARTTTSGCEALVAAHPFSYLDYSTGVRCCKDAE